MHLAPPQVDSSTSASARGPQLTRGPSVKALEDTAKALRLARMDVEARAYLQQLHVATVAAAFMCAVAAAVGAYLAGLGSLAALVLTLASGIGGATLVALTFVVVPRIKGSSRARRIDESFQPVVVLCYALSRGGMSPVDVFRVVAAEEATYGEISREFNALVTDIDWFGEDVVAAVRQAAATTPSPALQAFFEGFVAVLTSGADPRTYFQRQAESLLAQGESDMTRQLDQAALLAEVYVSGLLVLPLMLIVITSVLSVLSGGGNSVVSLLVFGLMPLGTMAYLVLVDLLLPTEPLSVPVLSKGALDDAGVEALDASTPFLPLVKAVEQADADGLADGPARRVRLQLRLQRIKVALRAAWGRLAQRALVKPASAIELSGSLALLIFCAGASLLLWQQAEGQTLQIAGTGLILASVLVALLPVSLFHEMRVARASRVENELPDTLSRLAGFNERGINLLQAFRIVGNSSQSPLARELATLERDVSWNGNLSAAIQRLRGRIATPRASRFCLLLDHASRASGNVREVLDIAAEEATSTDNLRRRRRQSMMSYVVVIYVVFAVFAYVVYMTSNLFYGETGFAAAGGSPAGGPAGLGSGIDAAKARLLFFHAVLVQGACCGLVAGRLGEGHLLSGIKHASLFTVATWFIFRGGLVA